MKYKRKTALLFALSFVTVVFMFAMTACSDKKSETPEIEKKTVTIAAGSTYNGYCKTIIDGIEPVLGDIEFDVQSKGSVINNIRGVAEGNADFAMSRADVLYQAYNGVELFDGEAVKNIRVVTGCYAEACQLVVSQKSKINSFEDIKGKTIAVGEINSLSEMIFSKILKSAGITEKDFKKMNMGYKDALSAIENEEIDGMFFVAGAPVTGIMKLAVTEKVKLVPIESEGLLKTDDKDSYFVKYTIPAGTYSGQEKDIDTPAVKTAVIVREDVSADTVYRITKAIYETKEAAAEKFEKCSELDEESALEGMTVPVHEGAEKYYKEIGVLK